MVGSGLDLQVWFELAALLWIWCCGVVLVVSRSFPFNNASPGKTYTCLGIVPLQRGRWLIGVLLARVLFGWQLTNCFVAVGKFSAKVLLKSWVLSCRRKLGFVVNLECCSLVGENLGLL